jgi:pimeloyl-ACP methyl ester carboxylesterase
MDPTAQTTATEQAARTAETDQPTDPGLWTETEFAANGQVRLAYDRMAQPGGQPLLLIMGLAASRFWWPDGLCRAFADQGFAVARYDQRDAGASTHLPDTSGSHPFITVLRRNGNPYSAEDMADDAVAVLDDLGWESAHLFGHSMGGAVAQRVALRHPDRVRTLTVSSSLPGDVAGWRALPYIRLGTLAKLARLKYPQTREGRIEGALAMARIIASPGYEFDEPVWRAGIERDVEASLADDKAQSRQIGARWHGPKVGEIDLPTLVLHGEQDPMLRPTAARATAAAVRGARLIIQSGVGHDLPGPLWQNVAAEVRALAGERPVGTPAAR